MPTNSKSNLPSCSNGGAYYLVYYGTLPNSNVLTQTVSFHDSQLLYNTTCGGGKWYAWPHIL